ncbi:hypothetical protein HII31_07443 [Pseudocercospora fuligena]|uniref:Uncharacterized protein n=1 Tax=Pseudocercospora fuligena TaxID=685502 RepID=A0A8H6VLS9_9PEZI|nr:hypothetical protein HII31_07443 [Pseudocercospora fuligena]
MPGVQIIDLTDDASDSETIVPLCHTDHASRLREENRRTHRDFWASIENGPRQHGPKRMRNIAIPMLGDNCPFLELPAEVRNRIYEHALGGHNLHMFSWNMSQKERDRDPWWQTGTFFKPLMQYDWRQHREVLVHEQHWLQYALCQCPDSDEETYHMSTDIPGEKDGQTKLEMKPVQFALQAYADRHRNCFELDILKFRTVGMRKLRTTPRLAMGLLRTCKQVYDEAALVPYYDNTFTFARGADLDFFVNFVLSEKQCAALQSIHFVTIHKDMRSKARCPPTILRHHFSDQSIPLNVQPKTVDLLAGLKSLLITLDIDGEAGRYVSWGSTGPRFTSSPGLKVQVIVRRQEYYFPDDVERARARAEELEYALVRSLKDVPTLQEARKQLEYAQMQSAHLEYEKIAATTGH